MVFVKEGVVSGINGDKARAARQQHNKILRRKRRRELSNAMSLEKKAKAIQAEPSMAKTA